MIDFQLNFQALYALFVSNMLRFSKYMLVWYGILQTGVSDHYYCILNTALINEKNEFIWNKLEKLIDIIK